jgi:hypothetical protein
MSMNYFFAAFQQSDIDAMGLDHSLIDKRLFEERASVLSTDVAGAWDVLANVLQGAGFQAGDYFDDALSNGGFLISAADVKQEAERLARWTPEQVAQAVRELDDDTDLYWLEVYKEEEDMLLEEFAKLVEFYRAAAGQGLGAVHYPA